MTVTALLFAGRPAAGAPVSPLEAWVAGARWAAVHDSLAQLARVGVDQVVVATNDPELAAAHRSWPVAWALDPPGAFHFGARLAQLLTDHPADAYAYFGAGSAPLLPDAPLAEALARVRAAGAPTAVANNPLSTDWLVFNCPEAVQARPGRLGRDNMLGPVLRREAGVAVAGLPPSAASRADLDTPADLAALSWHPDLPPALAAYLAAQPGPPELRQRWAEAGRVLHAVEGRVALIGRVSAAMWGELERRTRCWIRVLSEERGMTASGRLAAGRVRSLVAAHLWQVGPDRFCAELAEMAEAVFFDTRVALAHVDRWPPAADRFASDAGQAGLVADEGLRGLTAAAAAADIPILLGGHGLVTGDLYALLESGQAFREAR